MIHYKNRMLFNIHKIIIKIISDTVKISQNNNNCLVLRFYEAFGGRS